METPWEFWALCWRVLFLDFLHGLKVDSFSQDTNTKSLTIVMHTKKTHTKKARTFAGDSWPIPAELKETDFPQRQVATGDRMFHFPRQSKLAPHAICFHIHNLGGRSALGRPKSTRPQECCSQWCLTSWIHTPKRWQTTKTLSWFFPRLKKRVHKNSALFSRLKKTPQKTHFK